MKPNFTERDYERVRERIAKAEETTVGEIVPYVVLRSDDYEVVMWRAAALSVLFFLMVTVLVYLFYDGWNLGWLYTGPAITAGILACGGLGATAVRTFRSVFLLVAGKRLVARRARARAERAFLEEGIFRTRDQTGILIFISLWEHRIEVLPDTGIPASPETWTSVVDAARAELKRGDLVEALVAAVDTCSTILRSSMPVRKETPNPDQLENRLRLGN